MGRVPVVALAALCVSGAGCSFGGVRRPRYVGDRIVSDGCTTSARAPGADLFGAAVGVAVVGVVLAEPNDVAKQMVVGGGVALSAVEVASSIFGFAAISQCRRVREAEAEAERPVVTHRKLRLDELLPPPAATPRPDDAGAPDGGPAPDGPPVVRPAPPAPPVRPAPPASS